MKSVAVALVDGSATLLRRRFVDARRSTENTARTMSSGSGCPCIRACVRPGEGFDLLAVDF